MSFVRRKILEFPAGAPLMARRAAFFFLATAILASGGCVKKKGFVRGEGFTITFPPGWKMIEQDMEPTFNLTSKFQPYVVTYVSPEENPETFEPEASISIYTVKPDRQMWLEDEFPAIVETFVAGGFEILDKGQHEVDNIISWWLVYRYPQRKKLILEFYIINDNNIFYRIQYTAQEDKFPDHRQDFENAKATMKVSRW